MLLIIPWLVLIFLEIITLMPTAKIPITGDFFHFN